ncbi:MAG TPA: SDR family oxidoreductase [Opitutaceae bacterium]|nr:SDR family oxidoreductase [Opitutaceae bacterium]
MPAPVVLITGASQGIGAAIATGFARAVPGVRLALVARNVRNLRATAEACAAAGARAEIFRCDVSRDAPVAAMARAVVRRFRRVDVLVNNAGAFEGATFARTSAAMFDRLLAANLRSAFLVTRAFLPAMLRRGEGDVFFLSSIAGKQAYPNGAAYCAAKFGLTGLAQVLRAETKGTGVRVCSVHPGATWTPSWEGSGFGPERMMAAEDIARAILEIWRLDRRAVVDEVTLRPLGGDL